MLLEQIFSSILFFFALGGKESEVRRSTLHGIFRVEFTNILQERSAKKKTFLVSRANMIIRVLCVGEFGNFLACRRTDAPPPPKKGMRKEGGGWRGREIVVCGRSSEAAGRIDSDASFQKNRRRRRRDAKKIFFHSGKEVGLCFD